MIKRFELVSITEVKDWDIKIKNGDWK
jgi:hypothetical protein